MKVKINHVLTTSLAILLGYLIVFTDAPGIIYSLFYLASERSIYLVYMPEKRFVQASPVHDGMQIRFHGLTLTYPWLKTDVIKRDKTVHIKSTDGKELIIFYNRHRGILNEFKDDESIDIASIRSFFGRDMGDDYLLYKRILEITPRALNPLMKRKKAKAVYALLQIKTRLTRGWDGYAVHVVTPKIQGFEIPMKDHARIVKLSRNNVDYDLRFNRCFREKEIDQVLGTVFFEE